MSWRKLFLLGLVVLPFGLHSFGQSVADIAKKERQRQSNAQSKVIVSNRGALPTTSSAASTSSPSTPAAASTATAPSTKEPVKAVAVTDNKGRNEQYWRGMFQKAREALQRAEARADLLDLKQKELNTMLLRQTDVYNRENRIGAEMTATQKEIDEARRLVGQAQKNIADLEDELRRSGGPAGWAR